MGKNVVIDNIILILIKRTHRQEIWNMSHGFNMEGFFLYQICTFVGAAIHIKCFHMTVYIQIELTKQVLFDFKVRTCALGYIETSDK
jgi:hypothetical protein